MITPEAVIIVIGWITSLAVALVMGFYFVPKVAAARICRQFGLIQVEQDGEEIFAVKGPDGKPVKVPIGLKGEGEAQEIVMGYAGLGYSMGYITAEMAYQKTKMALLNIKGNISKKISAEAFKTGDPGLIMEFLPKKAQAAVAIAQMLGLGRNLGLGSAEGPAMAPTDRFRHQGGSGGAI